MFYVGNAILASWEKLVEKLTIQSSPSGYLSDLLKMIRVLFRLLELIRLGSCSNVSAIHFSKLLVLPGRSVTKRGANIDGIYIYIFSSLSIFKIFPLAVQPWNFLIIQKIGCIMLYTFRMIDSNEPSTQPCWQQPRNSTVEHV